MDNVGSNGGGSFKVYDGPGIVVVRNVHEAGLQEVTDVVKDVVVGNAVPISVTMT